MVAFRRVKRPWTDFLRLHHKINNPGKDRLNREQTVKKRVKIKSAGQARISSPEVGAWNSIPDAGDSEPPMAKLSDILSAPEVDDVQDEEQGSK